MQNFDVYFMGETLPDADPRKVREGVAQLFKVQVAAVDRLFTGKALRVKQGIDAEAASRYRAAFRDVGALIQIVPEGAAPPPAKSTPTPPVAPATEEIVLDASDVPAETPATVGDDITLAAPGATIDATPPPPEAQFDTSALEALPANSGTLEDCRVDKPPQPIGDISHLQLVDD